MNIHGLSGKLVNNLDTSTRKSLVEELKENAKESSQLGKAYMRLWRYDQASGYLKDATGQHVNNPAYLCDFSENELVLGLATAPRNEDAIKLRTEKFETALRNATRALEVDKKYIPGHKCKVLSLQALERYDEAAVACDEALAIDPKSSHFIEAREAAKKRQPVPRDAYKIGKTMFNSNFPMPYDQFDKTNAEHDEKYEKEKQQYRACSDPREIEIMLIDKLNFGFDPKKFKKPKCLQAHKTALTAYGKPLKEQVSIANKALKLSKKCPEAYNILSECADNATDAMKYYEKGISAAPLMFTTEVFKEECDKGDIWDNFYLRGYWRCLVGKANLLRKLGRYEEALQAFNELQKIDKGRSDDASHIKYHDQIVDVLISLKRYDECLKFMTESWSISYILHIWDKLLLTFITHGEKLEYAFNTYDSSGGVAKVAKYLFGLKKLPDTPEPLIVGENSQARAVSYVRLHKKHWEQVEGALEFSKKHHTENLLYNFRRSYSDEPTIAVCKKLYEKYLKYGTNEAYLQSCTHEPPFFFAAAKNGNLDILKYAFEEKKFDIDCEHKFAGTALHDACLYGQLEVVKYLVDKGASMTKFHDTRTPLQLAATYGEYECVKYILEKHPDLVNMKTNDDEPFVHECLGGAAMRCLDKGYKCHRCFYKNPRLHSRENVIKTLQLAIEKGVDVFAKVGWNANALWVVKEDNFTEAVEILEPFFKQREEERKREAEKVQKEKEEKERKEREAKEKEEREKAEKEKEQEEKEQKEKEEKEKVEREEREKEQREKEEKENEEREKAEKEKAEKEKAEKEKAEKEKAEKEEKEQVEKARAEKEKADKEQKEKEEKQKAEKEREKEKEKDAIRTASIPTVMKVAAVACAICGVLWIYWHSK